MKAEELMLDDWVRAEFRDIYFVHQLQHELRRVGKEIKL